MEKTLLDKNEKIGNTIKIDDAAIYYEVTGSEELPALLLLHGGMGSGKDFTALMPALASEYRIISIDSRGHGRSTLGRYPLTYQRLEQDVLQVLRHLGIFRTAILGFSDGGIVGYRLMISEPSLVIKLAAIGATYELKVDDPIRNIFAKITAMSWRNKFPDSYDSYQSLSPEPDFDRLVNSCTSMWLDSSLSGYPAMAVEQIKGKALIIRGDGDHLFTLQTAVDMVSLISQAVFANIPFAGHATHEDQPDIVMDIIKIFLTNENDM